VLSNLPFFQISVLATDSWLLGSARKPLDLIFILILILSLTTTSQDMLSSFTTKLALKKAGIPSDILSFPTEKREPNKLRKNPPSPSDNDADSSWSSWMSVRSLPLTVQPWLTPPPAAVSVGRVPGIGDKAPVDRTQKLRLGKRTLVVFLRCVGCACKSPFYTLSWNKNLFADEM
jgi:hypothetical protein